MMLLGFVIAQIIIFTVIVIVLKNLIFADTTSAVNRINRLDNMNREKERLLNQKLFDADKFIEERKKQLEEEEKTLQREAHRAATQLHDDILRKAKNDAEDIIKKAHDSREKMRAEAKTEAEMKAVDFSRDLLGRVLTRASLSSMNETLIQEFMAQVEKADLGRVGQDSQSVDIVVSHNINDETKHLIKRILDNKLGRSLEIVYKEDPLIVAGMLMQFGTMVVDGSLAQNLKEAADVMKDELVWKNAL